MDWNDENLEVPGEQVWWHAVVSFPGNAGISPQAAAVLAAALTGERFHFLRKEGKLRLRTERPAAGVLDRLVAEGLATSWASGIYDPETAAFGGPAGMTVAHDLFCADSPAALVETGSRQVRERCLLLISAMNRAARLDPFEIGDVWAKIAHLRPGICLPPDPRRQTAVAAMRRLLHADAAERDNAEPYWAARVEAFQNAGRMLARLNADGQLARGLRAVLAHHAIFAFNRAGVPVAEQAAAACLVQHITFTDTGPARTSAGLPDQLRETTMTTTTDPAELRHAMADTLTRSGHLRTPAIIDAFRTVERHRFIPGVDAQAAYAEDAVPIKHDENSEMISCISAPSIVATQLEQLDARAGDKILEAGAATGYNAALLSRLVGPGGHLWTIDVD